jgi:hypothetical protein
MPTQSVGAAPVPAPLRRLGSTLKFQPLEDTTIGRTRHDDFLVAFCLTIAMDDHGLLGI